MQLSVCCDDVTELKSASIHWLSCGRKAEPDVWTKMFCILTDSQLLMLDDLEVQMENRWKTARQRTDVKQMENRS